MGLTTMSEKGALSLSLSMLVAICKFTDIRTPISGLRKL